MRVVPGVSVPNICRFYEETLPHLPRRPRDVFYQAWVHGDLNGAIADLDQALQLDPQFLPAYIDRGTILYRVRKLGRAFADIAGSKRIEEPGRAKSAPASAGRPHADQAETTASVTPLSQRRKAEQKLPKEAAFAPQSAR